MTAPQSPVWVSVTMDGESAYMGNVTRRRAQPLLGVLYGSNEKQNQQDEKNQAKSPARRVTPATRVRPCGKHEKQEDQD